MEQGHYFEISFQSIYFSQLKTVLVAWLKQKIVFISL